MTLHSLLHTVPFVLPVAAPGWSALHQGRRFAVRAHSAPLRQRPGLHCADVGAHTRAAMGIASKCSRVGTASASSGPVRSRVPSKTSPDAAAGSLRRDAA